MKEDLQTFYRLVRRRKSVRSYSPRKVEKEKLERILETARLAPSAANCQPWRFIVLPKEGRGNFDKAVLRKEGFHNAPVIIAACSKADEAWVRREDGKNYAWVDVAIAVTEMIGAATAEGLGTCWIASFNVKEAVKLLSLPENLAIVALVTIGYPTLPLEEEKKHRKPLPELVIDRR